MRRIATTITPPIGTGMTEEAKVETIMHDRIEAITVQTITS
jgi:hypothetical protein